MFFVHILADPNTVSICVLNCSILKKNIYLTIILIDPQFVLLGMFRCRINTEELGVKSSRWQLLVQKRGGDSYSHTLDDSVWVGTEQGAQHTLIFWRSI